MTVKPLAAQRRHVELIGDPRGEADDLLDGRLVRDRDGDRAAHREADECHAAGADLIHGRACVVDARLEASPRLHPVAHLREAELRQSRCELPHEPLDRRAPRSLDLPRLPAVHAHDRTLADRAGDAHLRARRQLHAATPSVSATHAGSSPKNAGSIECAMCGDSRYVTSAPASSRRDASVAAPLDRDHRVERAVTDRDAGEWRLEIELESGHRGHEPGERDEPRWSGLSRAEPERVRHDRALREAAEHRPLGRDARVGRDVVEPCRSEREGLRERLRIRIADLLDRVPVRSSGWKVKWAAWGVTPSSRRSGSSRSSSGKRSRSSAPRPWKSTSSPSGRAAAGRVRLVSESVGTSRGRYLRAPLASLGDEPLELDLIPAVHEVSVRSEAARRDLRPERHRRVEHDQDDRRYRDRMRRRADPA